MLLKVDTAELLQLAEAFEVAAEHLQTNRPVVLEAVGVQNVSWAMQDYRVKSRGGQGGDGVTWAPVKPETVVGRLRKLKAYKAKSEAVRTNRRKLREGRKAVREEIRTLRKKLKVAKGKRAKAATANRGIVPAKLGKRIRSLESRLTKAKASRAKMISGAVANHRIGIDTGRQANALTFGVPALQGKSFGVSFTPRPGNSDPVPNAIFVVGDGFVTVGVNTSYGKAFDEDREIFGPGFHNADRVAKLENVAARANEILLRQAAEKIKVGGQTVTKSDLEGDIE